MPSSNILIYLIRRDLRVSDNPVIHHLASSPNHGFTHLLPVYVFPPHQIEVSGFINDGRESPYPEARSHVGRFWRCGPHRAKFLTASVWNLKESLEALGSGLTIRVGHYDEVLQSLIDGFKEKGHGVGAVWVTLDEGVEEKQDEAHISSACSEAGVQLLSWADEKYFIDDRDVNLDSAQDLPDVFTTYRKMMEPLRERPRSALPKPRVSSLPDLPPSADVADQAAPFEIPQTYAELEKAVLTPVQDVLQSAPPFPEGATSAHPFLGGESHARARLESIIKNGTVANYKSSRNGLLGADFSTKLSGYLALGCITARQIHETLVRYEEAQDEAYSTAPGYGDGENEGTKGVRFELLWRDYMRLCTKKFTSRLFRRSGFRNDQNIKWKSSDGVSFGERPQSPRSGAMLQRVLDGTTGMGLIDASQRELLHTGYTSNRARQNVASFLAKHLGIDWRYGAEWYEMLLIDYDVSSNWSNWQYVAGVGNDPRGEARIFNPVKQAFDYDKEGKYVKTWVPELRKVEKLENVFQVCTTPKEDWDRFGITGLSMTETPIKRIEFSVDGKPSKHAKRPFDRRRKDGRIRSNTSSMNQQSQSQPQPQHSDENHTEDRQSSGDSASQKRNHSQYDASRGPRMDYRGTRGGNRGGFRGSFRGGIRGRGGFGNRRGGAYRGSRGQYQEYTYLQGGSLPAQWASTQPGV